MIDMIKVKVNIEDASFWGVNSELLWASETDSGYVLENSPTYAYDISYKDTVSVDRDFVVTGIIARGGHSTYRILLCKDSDREKWEMYWKPLQDLGCSYESDKSGSVFSVDVKPEADIYEVYKLLEHAEHDGFWRFEEGHCGHSLQR